VRPSFLGISLMHRPSPLASKQVVTLGANMFAINRVNLPVAARHYVGRLIAAR
jgi:hypothetical protein